MDGVKENTSFKELTLEEAKQKGYSFAINDIIKGKKYFRMNVTNNIYDDTGKIAMFNIPVCN